jgi:Fur family ferric uptake transcriptional regulator
MLKRSRTPSAEGMSPPAIEAVKARMRMTVNMILRTHYHIMAQQGFCIIAFVQRDTAQRRAIRRVLDEAERPLGALEVLQASKPFAPGLGIATVYRNIKALVVGGAISTVVIPGEPPRYEAAGKGHHHHFLCESCGKVYELGGCLGSLKGLLPRDFLMTSHELLLHGRCADCAR